MLSNKRVTDLSAINRIYEADAQMAQIEAIGVLIHGIQWVHWSNPWMKTETMSAAQFVEDILENAHSPSALIKVGIAENTYETLLLIKMLKPILPVEMVSALDAAVDDVRRRLDTKEVRALLKSYLDCHKKHRDFPFNKKVSKLATAANEEIVRTISVPISFYRHLWVGALRTTIQHPSDFVLRAA